MDSLTRAKKLFGLVNSTVHWRLFWVLAVLSAGAVLEILSIGALLPLLQAMLDPNEIRRFASIYPPLKEISSSALIVGGCFLVLAVFLVKVVVVSLGNWMKWRVQARVYQTLSAAIFRSYIEKPISFHVQSRATDILRNVTTNVAQTTQYGFLSIVDFLSDCLMCVGIFVLLSFVKPLISFLALTSIVVLAGIYIKIGNPYFSRWGRRLVATSGDMYRSAMEPLIGIKIIKVLGRESYFESQFAAAVTEYSDTNSANGFQNQVPRQLLEMIAVLALVSIVIWTVLSGGNISSMISILAVFAAAVYRMTPAIVRMAVALQNFRVAQEPIDLVYDAITQAQEKREFVARGQLIDRFSNEIVLKDATFTYPGTSRPAVDAVNLVIGRGEAVAFVGSSGAGKTTVVDIMLGLQSLTSGTIAIDGARYSSVDQLRKGLFGYIAQEAFLIDDTVRRNIALGLPDHEIDERRVAKAIAMAAIEDVVEGLPQGLDTIVGDRGMRLSGGQRQRIGIARALYPDPDILIMDEATSSVDVTTEAAISSAINRLRGEKTIVIIAHRLSTVRECDRLYFFKDGRIENEGRFDDLVRMNNDFAEMVQRLGAGWPGIASSNADVLS